MGYESKIYLALPSTWASDVHVTDDEGHWTPEVTGRKALHCQIVAMVDLSKAGYDNATGLVLRDARETEKTRLALLASQDKEPVGYGLYTSGDVFDDQDKYGDPIAPVPLDVLLEALRHDYEAPGGGYRRFALAIDVLSSWDRLRDQFPPDPLVLHYGY